MSAYPEFNYGLKPFYWIGSQLTKPTEAGTRLLCEVTDPRVKGREEAMGQKKRKPLEIARRICLAPVAAFLTLAGLPFQLVGGSIKALTTRAQSPYTIRTYHSQRFPRKEGSYSALTWNLAAMPCLIRRYNRTRPVEIRMREVVAFIQEHHRSARVLSFQEVFTRRARKILIQGLSEFFPHVLFSAGAKAFGIDSGLMCMSKDPIKKARFHRFSERRGENRLAGKGAVALIVDLGEDRSGLIINTHMDSNGLGCTKPAQTQARQFQEIHDSLLKPITQELETLEVALFMGDTNCEIRGGKARELFLSKKLLSRLHRPTSIGSSTLAKRIPEGVQANSPKEYRDSKKRIDYNELIRGCRASQELNERQTRVDLKAQDRSDHFPVITTISYGQGDSSSDSSSS